MQKFLLLGIAPSRNWSDSRGCDGAKPPSAAEGSPKGRPSVLHGETEQPVDRKAKGDERTGETEQPVDPKAKGAERPGETEQPVDPKIHARNLLIWK